MTAVPEDQNIGDDPQQRRQVRAVLDMIGLSARARALVSGTSAVRSAVREGSVHQVILATDGAEGQRQKLVPLLEARRIPYHIVFTQDELGAASGRAPVSAIAISNPDLARRIGELLKALRSGE